MRSLYIAPIVFNGRHSDGMGWWGGDVNLEVVASCYAYRTEGGFMDVIDELRKRYDEAATLWQQYDERLTKFRAQVKNDVTSLEAGARKTTEAVQRMNKAYADTFAQLNSPDMMAAIQNAERLAAAMQSISNLQPHKLMFAVVDSTKGE